MKNYYEILEVNTKASQDIIQKVFKIQIKKYHPDLVQQEYKESAEDKVKELNEAYEVLSNEEKRKEYDKNLETELQKNDNAYIIQDLNNENLLLKQTIKEQSILLDDLLYNRVPDENSIYKYSNIDNNIQNDLDAANEDTNESVAKYYFNCLKSLFFRILITILIILLGMVLLYFTTGINLFLAFYKYW